MSQGPEKPNDVIREALFEDMVREQRGEYLHGDRVVEHRVFHYCSY